MMDHFTKHHHWNILLTLSILTLVSLCAGSPHSIFKHFETLRPHHISMREKRTALGRKTSNLTVSFSALQKHFSLLLNPGTPILHPQVRIKLVDNLGRVQLFSLKNNKFYIGNVAGETTYKVDASETGGVWMIHIYTPTEFYAVEPMRLYDDNVNQKDMIIYRARDIKQQNLSNETPFCEEIRFESLEPNDVKKSTGLPSATTVPFNGMVFPVGGDKQNSPQTPIVGNSKQFSGAEKKRRSIKARKLKRRVRNTQGNWLDKPPTECDILAVVDFTLYNGVGARNPASIVQTMVQTYSLVDKIFRETDFGLGSGTGHGIVLHGIIIHTNFSDSPSNYNSANTRMPAKDILLGMTQESTFSDYCIVHLSTQRDVGTTLGLASRASPDRDWDNGMCSGLHDVYTRNVGFSTVIGPTKQIVPLKLYSKVVAHEIGHNWGARHDPISQKTSKCSPSTSGGGKFIMWPFAVLGKGPNSSKFSPCSTADIRAVLVSRGHKCLKSKSEIYDTCGNGILEKSEECDPGFGDIGEDPCCQQNCGLRPGAQCSFKNSPCCTPNCTVAPPTQKCYPNGGLKPCYKPSHCSGDDPLRCPAPMPLPNGSPCEQGGSCKYGRCMSFCERHGQQATPIRHLRSCVCDHNRTAMCRLCCMDDAGGKCQAIGGPLQDGSACLIGDCRNGVCSRNRVSANDDVVFLKGELIEWVDASTKIMAPTSLVAMLSFLNIALVMKKTEG